ncbi:MAG: manganese/iron ABC transporter ATP-binding protein [Candidatus Liberibacter europaeus]|uniref:Manganese/iron ABC transporter ATP-binding protein n=1 Tax=Candidatus Liberibacter europaeus TaxID=744859 RepID=A0A2T4VXG0_9HYPH|nr:manganese/iron ABC transporter ATP-binding protein [Candidatus Liberibacter europaeus]PTL86472.1 MAG: manganese/iron ABC transporter ATP-binding protein [Candidatus Liberibacter europaeus]
MTENTAKIEQGLKVKNVSVTYRNGYSALRNVSFFIPKKTITALIGMNGAGKSTLFQAIMGFVPMDEGSISIFGKTVEESLKGNMIAYIPQVESIDWNFPILVEEVVMMGLYKNMGFLRIPSKKDRETVIEALESVGMAFMRKRQIGELSIGQQKRVFIARALAKKSKIIILDEPFAAIDFKTEREIISLLQTLKNDDSTILISTHNINSVPAFCDCTIFLNKRVIAYGETHDVFSSNNIQETFGDSIDIPANEYNPVCM